MHTNKISVKRSKNATLLTALAGIILITLFSVVSCEEFITLFGYDKDSNLVNICDKDTLAGSSITCTVDFEYNSTPYSVAKTLNTTKDESVNIINIFLEEDFDPNKNLEISIDSTTYNFSDTTPEIFTANDGIKDFKFRVNIFRRPIIISTKPAANTESNYNEDDGTIIGATGEKVVYENSGADATSIRSFVQTDYYYVPTINKGTITDNPAPAFALYTKDADPKLADIFKTLTRVLRNFTTDDGNTIFFDHTAINDSIPDDTWTKTQEADFDKKFVKTLLIPETEYNLYWAVQADNGDFFDKLASITTKAKSTSETNPIGKPLKYFGNGGMAIRPLTGIISSFLSVMYLSAGESFDDAKVLIFEQYNPSIKSELNSVDTDKLATNYNLLDTGNDGSIVFKNCFLESPYEPSIRILLVFHSPSKITNSIRFIPFYEK